VLFRSRAPGPPIVFEPLQRGSVEIPLPPGFTFPAIPAPDNSGFEQSLLQQYDGFAILQKVVQ
jgi:hypothetical protein